MGQYLSVPITDKVTQAWETEHVIAGISSQQGWRRTQEDAHIAERLGAEAYLFGVFDGHGGGEVAKFCASYLPSELAKSERFIEGEYGQALTAAFHRMDELLGGERAEELSNMKAASLRTGEFAGTGIPVHGTTPCGSRLRTCLPCICRKR